MATRISRQQQPTAGRPLRALYDGGPAPVSGGAAPTFVQALGHNGVTTTVSTLVITVGATSTVGNSILVIARGSSAHAATGVTDSKGNSYNVDVSTGTGVTVVIARATITTPLVASDTITVSYLPSTAIADAVAYEYSGAMVLDQAVGATDVSGTTAAYGPTPATTAAPEIAIAALGWNTTETGAGPAPDAAWTVRTSGLETMTGGGAIGAEQVLNSSGATPSVTWTFPVAAASAGIIATYHS